MLKIAEITELANVRISSLGSANYFSFIFLSMFNNSNLDTANVADYTNHDPLVRHKYEIDSHNMVTKDYTNTMDYSWVYLNTHFMAYT